ncbi:unnamed protein product, partial [Musa textilis]
MVSQALHGAEIITVAPPSDSLSMCLANLGSGTPFLSLLELRHIDNHLVYQDANQSAALLFYSRYNLGSLTNDTLRYSATFQLTEKSDVYSFGVVLLELVTGRSAMLDQPKRCHLVQWVRWRVAEADITEV